MRFANQFVADINKNGQVSGILINLKFINRSVGKPHTILLTEPGWIFGTLFNPVLDSEDMGERPKFSVDEVDFLLNHISSNVPTEDFAYRVIMRAILEGASSPKEIDYELNRHVQAERREKLSSSFLSSQRSGAISRMSDLGLVERKRDGIHVKYIVTKSGESYISTRSNTGESEESENG